MKGLTFVTFGFDHCHIIGDNTFDKDTIAIIQADNRTHGRELAFKYFKAKFCFEYYGDEFDFSKMVFFPNGFIAVNF